MRCAPAAEARGDQLHGTAPPAERFVVVEQPGAWGADALAGSRLPPAVRAHLVQGSRRLGARLLLVRRAHRDPETPLRLGVADARRGHERLVWSTFRSGEELLELPFEPPRNADETPAALLTCTHGRKDPCCARRGWPVTQALTAAYPERAWQCSHVGGDRFAANLLVLPHGLYFGHVTPAVSLEIVRALDRGELVADALRGRSVDPPATQSALHYASTVLGENRLDALRPLGPPVVRDDRVEVRVDHAGTELVVVLRRTLGDTVERPTCGAVAPARFVQHELVSLDAA